MLALMGFLAPVSARVQYSSRPLINASEQNVGADVWGKRKNVTANLIFFPSKPFHNPRPSPSGIKVFLIRKKEEKKEKKNV